MTDHILTPREVIALCREREIQAVDLRFMDFPGTHKHFTIPASALTEASFEDGFAFDASSLRGWQAINESDMLVVPQPETAVIDPFRERTLSVTCNIQDPVTREDYAKDPRNVARKAAMYMQSTGIADECRLGAELEFFVFDSVRFDQSSHEAYYHVDSAEGQWNRGRPKEQGGPNGNAIRRKEGYFPVPPSDALQDLRTEIMLLLADGCLPVDAHYHEVASGGQCELDLGATPFLHACDGLVRTKYTVRNAAASHGKSATFMPKPLYDDAGSGMHLHLSLHKDGKALFDGSGYGGLSDTAMFALGGLLKHAPAIMAFCCPTTNSYKRLVPDFEAPINLTYSYRNRSAAVRIPVPAAAGEKRRLEFRLPDPSANAYLASAAILMAMLDGIQNRLDPGPPLDKDIYDLEPDELTGFPPTPATLADALTALRDDHDFLLRGDVFTDDVIDTWIWYKTEHEVNALRRRPHPWEFTAYFDA